MFEPVDPRVSFPALEQATLRWWRERGVAERSLAGGDRARPFVFFEGPPTTNGQPGVHHVEARAVKDVINRYQRMRGRYVVGARAGWDTHGLPVEVQVERELGFRGKADIEKYGVAAFNAACRASADKHIRAFERVTERMGYWLDLEHPYTTYDNRYVESLWWVFQQLWQRDLLFRDYKTTMHCPRCGTTLSDHEVAQGYADDVDDPSVWVRFRLAGAPAPLDGAALLAWTTTPWTLPANVALAVHPNATYLLAEARGERLLLAEALADKVLGAGGYAVLARYAGRELAGLRYQPLFGGVPAAGAVVDRDTAYRVVADEFVSLEEGTGVVHVAPAYGDLEVGRAHGLPTLFSVDLGGNMLPEYADVRLAGMFFKDADQLVERNLKERGLLFRSGRVKHTYPFCWRCGTPLLHYAKQSWYVRTTAARERLLAHNQAVGWLPEHVRDGRFGKWLENNVDWAVSRERYWGTPLPIWACAECGALEVLGSVAELSARAGRDLAELDLHRPYVDEPSWACRACGGAMRRVSDVADCWFDAGAMQVAQWHYPFENRELFEQAKQADFVAEGIDQTRGWFYTSHALATLLFDRPAFKHALGLGILAGADGRRMSKSRGTAVDPLGLFEQFGADAVRWYMFASAPPYNNRVFLPEHVGDLQRQTMLTLWNTYAFFVTYANLDGWTPRVGVGSWELGGSTRSDTSNSQLRSPNSLDQWALARLHALVRHVTAGLESYDVHAPAKAIESFVEELSNWYVRRSRRRFWKAEDDADKQAAYQTLYTCLTTLARLLAPFMPFLAEAMWQNLVRSGEVGVRAAGDGATSPAPNSQLPTPESVHLAPWPEYDASLIDAELLADTALLLETISLGRAARRGAALKVRQPLGALWVRVPTASAAGLKRFEAELRDELNVKSVRYLDAATDLVEYRFKPNLRVVGKQYGKLVPALTAALKGLEGDVARAVAHAHEAGQPITLVVDGQALELAPEAVLVESSSPTGYAVAESGGVLVALDTTVTPELRAEGLARELVRNIQDARKAAGFAIADRITVTLAGAGDELAQVAQAWGEYIRAETLADALELGEAGAGAHTEALELDGQSLTLGVRRAG
jgi:isoleucyl-tRNA synthetase